MNLISIINKIRAVGLRIFVLKAVKKLVRPFINYHKRKQLLKESTFVDLPPWLSEIEYSYFQSDNYLNDLNFSVDDISKIEKNFNHIFDLLGSDNLNFDYNNINKINELIELIKNNVEINSQNRYNSIKILKLIDTDYRPINWQCDSKSKYCWKSFELSDEIQYGNVENVDIKVPWELARFNDFPVLAVYYLYSKERKIKQRIEYEFRNRILDFIAMNPPHFGVNWINTMEVGIRAVNWLVSYDIISHSGVKLDQDFKDCFFSSIYSHYKFIIEKPEWSSGMRGNHYFAGIVSLLILSAYLPISSETTETLLFSINELNNEVFYQFNEDGSNFEASTYYHCFVLEILLFALYFLLKLPQQKINSIKELKSARFSLKKKLMQNSSANINYKDGAICFDKEFVIRLVKILEFTDVILLKDGTTVNIGDSDSGHFIRFSWNNFAWMREIINYILLNDGNNNRLSKKFELNIFIDLANKIKHEMNDLKLQLNDTHKSLYLFDNFGLYIIKNQYFKLIFRCGSIGQRGKGGHAHNDQLSFVLVVDEFPLFIDSGTYIYTGNHIMRNKFRSTEMHNTLSFEGLEQNQWITGNKDELFWLSDTSKAKIINIGESSIEGIHYGYGKPTRRNIKIDGNTIIGEDSIDLEDIKTINFHINPCIKIINLIDNHSVELEYNDFRLEITTGTGEIRIEDSLFSPAYGVIEKNKKIIIITQKNKINWKITLKK